MAGAWLGLIEMGFVLCLALGWGIYELMSLKRLRAPPPLARKDDDQRS